MSRGGSEACENLLPAVLSGASTGAWPGASERGIFGLLGIGRIGRSVLAMNPATAQARTIGSQMRRGTLRLNSEAKRLMWAFREQPAVMVLDLHDLAGC